MAQTYILEINEAQRKVLLSALSLDLGLLCATGDACDLFETLTELPDTEAKQPGVIHGLCY